MNSLPVLNHADLVAAVEHLYRAMEVLARMWYKDSFIRIQPDDLLKVKKSGNFFGLSRFNFSFSVEDKIRTALTNIVQEILSITHPDDTPHYAKYINMLEKVLEIPLN